MQIVYFGNDWFGENRTSSHHIARLLGDRHELLYVECPGLRAPKATVRDATKLWKKLRNAVRAPRRIGARMWHITMPQIPFRALPFVDTLNRILSRLLVARALRRLGFESPVLWFVVPHPAALAGRLGESFLVYYCIDDYASLPDVDGARIRPMDEALARRADQVFVSSPALLQRQQRLNRTTTFSPHGVDVELFGQALDPALPPPEGIGNLPHPIVGFYGIVDGRVDRDLLRSLASARPHWTFLLIGLIATDVRELQQLPNVVFAGAQPYESLPRWAKTFDVAVIPYQQTEHVRNINPLKLREYLATGKPVVSVWMPEVERFADCVAIARTPDEFLREIETALRTDTLEKREARRRSVAGMTWKARVDEVLAVVQKRMREKAADADDRSTITSGPSQPRIHRQSRGPAQVLRS